MGKRTNEDSPKLYRLQTYNRRHD